MNVQYKNRLSTVSSARERNTLQVRRIPADAPVDSWICHPLVRVGSVTARSSPDGYDFARVSWSPFNDRLASLDPPPLHSSASSFSALWLGRGIDINSYKNKNKYSIDVYICIYICTRFEYVHTIQFNSTFQFDDSILSDASVQFYSVQFEDYSQRAAAQCEAPWMPLLMPFVALWTSRIQLNWIVELNRLVEFETLIPHVYLHIYIYIYIWYY